LKPGSRNPLLTIIFLFNKFQIISHPEIKAALRVSPAVTWLTVYRWSQYTGSVKVDSAGGGNYLLLCAFKVMKSQNSNINISIYVEILIGIDKKIRLRTLWCL